MSDRSRLRIAYFNQSEVASGAESLIRSSIKNVLRRGHESRLYVARSHRAQASNGQLIPFLPAERLVEKLIRRVCGWNDTFFPSTSLLSRDPWLRSADVWHFHNLHGHFVSIPLLAAESRKRLIVLSPVDQFLSTGYCPYTLGCERYREGCGHCPQVNLPYPGISRDATRALLAMKKRALSKSRFYFLVHTDYLAKHYASTFVSGRPIERIYYGVNVQVFRPLDRRDCAAKLGVDLPSGFVVGLMHSYVTDKRKGLLPLLDSLRLLAESHHGKFEVLVVGYESAIAREFATPNLTVTTLPFLETGDELAAALNLCDVLLYPTKAENLSLTCLAAMACGVPVVSSNVGGQSEAIEDGINGFFCEPGRNDQIVERVLRLSADPSLAERVSFEARRTAITRFDIDMYVTNLVAYYERLIQSDAPE